MAVTTASDLRIALNDAINRYMLAKGCGKTDALTAISGHLTAALKLSKKLSLRRLYAWLGEENFPSNADNIISTLTALDAGTVFPAPKPTVKIPQAETRIITQIAENSTLPTGEDILIPILGNIPLRPISELWPERIGKATLPAWMLGGRFGECYGLLIKDTPHGLAARAGDLAILRRGGDMQSDDWVVIGENNHYAIRKLNDAVAEKHRFTVSGVVLAILNKMR